MFVHAVHMRKINILSNKRASLLNTHDILKLQHVSAPRCRLQGVVITKVYKPTCQLCFVRSF